jgi:hypothetical protein
MKPIVGMQRLAIVLLPLALMGCPRKKDPVPVVAFSDFLAEVHAGQVTQIHIKGRDYVYWVQLADAPLVQKHTIGPVPDIDLVASLRPTDVQQPFPKVIFEQ